MSQNPNQSLLNETSEKINRYFANTHFAFLGKIITSPMFWIELLLLIYVFASYPPLPTTSDDTNSYTLYDENILLGETDYWRTPVYPYFIKAVYALTGGEEIKVRLAEPGEEQIAGHVFISGRQTALYVYWFQTVVLLISLIPYFYATKYLLCNKTLCFFTTLFTGYSLLGIQSWILTEPLSTSITCVFFSLVIFYIQKPSYGYSIIISLLVIFMAMLRPAFIYLFPLLFGFWLLRFITRKLERKFVSAGIVSLCISTGLLMGYCQLNKVNHGSFEISQVGTINQLDIILNTGFYKKSPDSEKRELINQYPLESGPMQFIIRRELHSKYTYSQIKTFVSQTIKQNLPEYIILTMKRMYWEMNVYNLTLIYLVGAIDFIFTLFLWVSFKNIPWCRLACWLSVYVLLFGVFFGAQSAFDRLFLVVSPVYYFMIIRYISLLHFAWNKPKEDVITYLKSTL